jgi:hypothetical protein
MKLTPSQRLMADDGAPSICFLTAEQRAAWWKANPAVAMPAFSLEVRADDEATRKFRAEEAERRRLASLASIARMKNRMASKKVDFTKMRWDARRNKFVEDHNALQSPRTPVAQIPPRPMAIASKRILAVGRGHRVSGLSDSVDWSRVTKDNAEAVARLNSIWKPEYEKLRGTGRIVMTVLNILRNKIKRQETVLWP